ncbi:MAG TPA: pyruvate kinase [Verrucomicrobiae bacterium]|nr:pyruvate kinase [Verrucomicrobiae bacterium]
MRRTKIICTIGPSTESPEMLGKMIAAGMDVARLNMSHATHGWTRETFDRIRDAAERIGRPCTIMMDTQGPAIRTGDLPLPLHLEPGDVFELTVKGARSEEEKSVDVNYPNLVNDIQVGDTVLVDNGVIRLKVLEKLHRRMRCEVLTEGELGSRRHINLPGVKISMPSITEKDRRDISFGLSLGVDLIALSFVRERKDVEELRAMIGEAEAETKVISKIEDQLAVENLFDLIDASDGIMVARGDLGIECPYEELPIIQRRTVKACIRYGKPVIVATHMLESMIENPMPTRAEVTDVANAVFEQADAMMLSGESTVGKYPLECVDVLNRIAERIERSGGAGYAERAELKDERQKVVRSAVVMANELKAKGILVFTRHGYMAQFTSWLRPEASPIFAFTNSDQVRNQLNLLWGVAPFVIEFSDDPESTILRAERLLREKELLAKGDQIVIVSDILARDKLINAVQMRLVE